MKDPYEVNISLLHKDQELQPIPTPLLKELRSDEAIIWIPENLSRTGLKKRFPDLSILENQLVHAQHIERGTWIRTSIANEPPFLELSAKEFSYITRKMGVVPFSLEVYLYVQWFCKQTLGDFIDREYWTWLPETRFDRSGLLMGGIDKLGQFDFHGWMPDFQSSFCGGRYFHTAGTPPEAASRIALEWEYDKRETSYKHWTSKLEKDGAESAFAAYHLLRDFELMRLYIRMFGAERLETPQDLTELHARWSERIAHEPRERLHGLALQQVDHYRAMLNDLIGYIMAGIEQANEFVPYRLHNGLKNIRNYYLVVNHLLEEGQADLLDTKIKLVGVIRKITELADRKPGSKLAEDVALYFGSLRF